MNQNLRKWIKALRSGEYEQTKMCLRDDNGYCCLGVAAELYRQETGRGYWSAEDSHKKLRNYAFHIDDVVEPGVLPKPVCEWLGIYHADGTYDDCRALSIDNDGGASFEQIADTIEKNQDNLKQKWRELLDAEK